MDIEMLLVVCKNNSRMLVDKRLKLCIKVWSQIFDDDEEIVDFETDPQILQKINEFYQLHQYEQNQIVIVERIETSNIDNLMDLKSKEFLQGLGFKPEKLDKESVKEWFQNISPLLNECYRLNCIDVAYYFYIEGLTEKEFQQFAQKWDVQYPLPPLRQRQIVESNKFVFERLSKK